MWQGATRCTVMKTIPQKSLKFLLWTYAQLFSRHDCINQRNFYRFLFTCIEVARMKYIVWHLQSIRGKLTAFLWSHCITPITIHYLIMLSQIMFTSLYIQMLMWFFACHLARHLMVQRVPFLQVKTLCIVTTYSHRQFRSLDRQCIPTFPAHLTRIVAWKWLVLSLSEYSGMY